MKIITMLGLLYDMSYYIKISLQWKNQVYVIWNLTEQLELKLQTN